MAIDDFLGDWNVKRADGTVIQKGDQLLIARDAAKPPNGVVMTRTGAGLPEAWNGEYDEITHTISIAYDNVTGQLSMLTTNTGFQCIYGTAVVGDPEEAGVWGGERP